MTPDKYNDHFMQIIAGHSPVAMKSALDYATFSVPCECGEESFLSVCPDDITVYATGDTAQKALSAMLQKFRAKNGEDALPEIPMIFENSDDEEGEG